MNNKLAAIISVLVSSGVLALTSLAFSPIATAAPAALPSASPGKLNVKTPTISGTVKVGKTVKANTGTWKAGSAVLSGADFKYQWYRAGKTIAGANQRTYLIKPADYKKKLTVKVTGVKKGYAAQAKTSKGKKVGAGALSTAIPRITGTVATGKQLVASTGCWKAGSAKVTSVKYQWYRNKSKIKKATKATYVPVAADKGKKIRVKVTGAASGYAKATKYSAYTAKVLATSTGAQVLRVATPACPAPPPPTETPGGNPGTGTGTDPAPAPQTTVTFNGNGGTASAISKTV
ncbi:MAG: hypothetical protein LBU38_00425, partial [Propionibacteriaceae bacterium]|nr:hypothetical protein [Propionibacteriaceae bacterium]